jgi:hypoxanthine-guanine phosphoribosyltransferase
VSAEANLFDYAEPQGGRSSAFVASVKKFSQDRYSERLFLLTFFSCRKKVRRSKEVEYPYVIFAIPFKYLFGSGLSGLG